MLIDNIIKKNFPSISDKYKEFAIKKDACRDCKIYDCYKQVTQAEGNANNPIFMFIGEAPGSDEVKHVRPFIGVAGQYLRQELRKYGDIFTKQTVLISNVLPCRPLDNKFPEAGPLDGNMVLHCVQKWLYQEIKIVRPKIIVTLGKPAFRYMTGITGGITENRGTWRFVDNFMAWNFATYHPSYVLRNINTDKQYIVEQFSRDIESVANSWHTFVGVDKRLSMNVKDFKKYIKKQKAINTAKSMGLIS